MKKTIKLIIFPGNFLPNIGGLETHVDEFVKYLSKNNNKFNYDITIFAPNTHNAKEKEIIHNNVKVIRYPAFELVNNFPFPKFWTFKFWKLYFGLYKNRYDLVMTRTRFFINTIVGCKFAKFRLKRIRWIHVEHGSSFVILNSKLKTKISKFYDKTIGKLIFLLSDKNIAISQAVYDFVKENFIKKKDLPIIRRGLDFEIYNIKKTNKDYIDLGKNFKNKIKIGYIGRLYKWKGVENTIKAFLNLDEKIRNNSVLLIIGDGEDYERLKKLAKKELDKSILFFGYLDFKKAISIFKQLDIYVHSSYEGGGLSNSLLQAMYCKCGIVASPNEGAKEVIINNENGLLLRNNSPKEINEGLYKLITMKKTEFNKLCDNAHKTIKENFSWEKVINEYEKIFEEVLK